jgi:hypothetical protein
MPVMRIAGPNFFVETIDKGKTSSTSSCNSRSLNGHEPNNHTVYHFWTNTSYRVCNADSNSVEVCGEIYVMASWKGAVSHRAGPSDMISELGGRVLRNLNEGDILLSEGVGSLPRIWR